MILNELVLIGSIFAIIFFTSVLKLNSFISLLLVSLVTAIFLLPVPSVVPVLKEGFGGTLKSIGLIVVLGTIIGIILDQSGAAISIAKYFMRKTGKRKAPMAMGITGLIAGLPIFCDSAFIVLSGICRSLARSSKTAITVLAPVLAVSLYGIHCLVPPHPGATAAAGIIGAPIGNVILLGIVAAVPGIIAAYIFIRLRPSKVKYDETRTEETDNQEPGNVPSTFISFLPILTPLVLITVKSVFFLISPSPGTSVLKITIGFIGDPVIALLAGCLAGIPLLRNYSMQQWNKFLEIAIEKAGPILIITAAGGTFGAVIKESGVVNQLSESVASLGLGILIPYLIAVILKTSQGSSTIAVITAASISAPLLGSLGLDTEWGKTLVILAMGAGSMMFSHANDSYFWVVSKFSGMSTSETLKYYSLPTVMLSVTSFIVISVLSTIIL